MLTSSPARARNLQEGAIGCNRKITPKSGQTPKAAGARVWQIFKEQARRRQNVATLTLFNGISNKNVVFLRPGPATANGFREIGAGSLTCLAAGRRGGGAAGMSARNSRRGCGSKSRLARGFRRESPGGAAKAEPGEQAAEQWLRRALEALSLAAVISQRFGGERSVGGLVARADDGGSAVGRRPVGDGPLHQCRPGPSKNERRQRESLRRSQSKTPNSRRK
jgi:hypothetical protein